MNQAVGKVPYEIQHAQYQINKMFADTFKTSAGKKCLEYMRQEYIERKTLLDRFTVQGQPMLNSEAGVKNFIIDIMQKIKRAEDGPPTPPEGETNA